MSMFCYQCQEAASCTGCTTRGVCGKQSDTAALQDCLVDACRGLAVALDCGGNIRREDGHMLQHGLFITITNANFDNAAIAAYTRAVLARRDELLQGVDPASLPGCARRTAETIEDMLAYSEAVSVLATKNEDVRSLRELLIYGMKGVAAYGHHAHALGYEDDDLYRFYVDGLVSTTRELSVDDRIGWVLKAGEAAVQVMKLLDTAHNETYGSPELSQVNLGVRDRPGILISGHDMRDMQDLLEQTEGTGVDVYTHCEMLPAHAYPAFKKYDHLVGNYGGSWWHQNREFERFHGAILMTTNCITPVQDSYRDRIFTTGAAGFDGVPHIADRPAGGSKDFSAVIERAKSCAAPEALEEGTLTTGFAHAQVLALADKVVAAVKSGAIKRFVVMAGCDGRHKNRDYFSDVAKALPQDAVILTAGCAKYRYNKLDLGDIGGIPRVLDAGQCNDSYSLVVTALKLAEVFGVDSVNDLPISYDIAWYEQKAVCVLLALLSLGVKGIRIGPTLPAFLSPAVAQKLVETFDLKVTGEVDADVQAIMQGA